MGDSEHRELWDRVNTVRESASRIDERQVADRATIAGLERRVARLEMACIAIGVGAAYVVWQLVGSGVGIMK